MVTLMKVRVSRETAFTAGKCSNRGGCGGVSSVTQRPKAPVAKRGLTGTISPGTVQSLSKARAAVLGRCECFFSLSPVELGVAKAVRLWCPAPFWVDRFAPLEKPRGHVADVACSGSHAEQVQL